MTHERHYRVVDPLSTKAERPPDYERVVVALTNRELLDELAAGRGSQGYQEALRAEKAEREARDPSAFDASRRA